MIAEDHYYAYGLKIASISSKSISNSLNPNMTNYGYQGSFSEEVSEFELNYNEFDLRNYDPQIGRWTTPDPYDQFSSPYNGMGTDPANNLDPSGGIVPFPINAITSSTATISGTVVSGLSATISSIATTVSVSLSVLSVAGKMAVSEGISSNPPDEFDQNGKKISDLGGDKINFYHQADGSTKVVDMETCAESVIKDGENLLRGYGLAKINISWARITAEWVGGVGATKTLIADFNNSNKGAFKSLNSALSSYASKARKDVLSSGSPKNIIKMTYGDANPFVAQDMWEQMWGRTTISWYKLGEKVLFLMTDSKSFRSLTYRKLPSWKRGKFPLMGNTYQTYIWIESMSEIRAKNTTHDYLIAKDVEKKLEFIRREIRTNKF